jgi:hypothetical protein
LWLRWGSEDGKNGFAVFVERLDVGGLEKKKLRTKDGYGLRTIRK